MFAHRLDTAVQPALLQSSTCHLIMSYPTKKVKHVAG